MESCQWLHYLCQLVGVAREVVGVVHESGLPVLIHCSDGWDRTTQVVALAQLLLDPYYRTIRVSIQVCVPTIRVNVSLVPRLYRIAS